MPFRTRIPTCILSSAVALTALLATSNANAVTITTFAEVDNDGVISDTQSGSGAPPSSLFSEALDPTGTDDVGLTADPSAGPGFARAAQNDAGFGAVEARSTWTFGAPSNRLTARSTFSETITNTSGSVLDYSYDFTISPIELLIADFAGGQIMTASYTIEITIDGTPVFFSQAILEGGQDGFGDPPGSGHTLTETGTDLGGTSFGIGGSVFGYDFDPFSDTLDLGTLDDGDSLLLAYVLSAEIVSPAVETGAAARIGDPGDLDGAAGLSGAIRTSGPTSQISEPGTLTLLGFGLAACAIARRRVARRDA